MQLLVDGSEVREALNCVRMSCWQGLCSPCFHPRPWEPGLETGQFSHPRWQFTLSLLVILPPVAPALSLLPCDQYGNYLHILSSCEAFEVSKVKHVSPVFYKLR